MQYGMLSARSAREKEGETYPRPSRLTYPSVEAVSLEYPMEMSPRIALSYLAPQQAQKHVTVNEALRRLDAVVALSVKSRTVAAEPASPADGDAYILPAGKTGAAWGPMTALAIAAFQDGAWAQITPGEGWRAFVQDTNEFLFFDGAAWTGAAQWGVNADADAVNRLAVRSNAVLFDAVDAAEGGSGDAQVKVNKETAAGAASHIFQTGFSGRAEFGLTGDDDFHLKVSPDGAAWTEALTVARSTGEVYFPNNVGIGVADPLQALHLQSANAFQPQILLENKANDVYGGYWNTQKSRNGGPVLAGDALGTFVFKGVDSNSVAQNSAFITCTVESVASGRVSSKLRFMTVNTAGVTTTGMQITAEGLVAIGGVTPAVKLDVDGPVKVKSYAKTALPAASAGAGQIVYVSDETGGAVLAFSDGTDWRRVTDRAVVS